MGFDEETWKKRLAELETDRRKNLNDVRSPSKAYMGDIHPIADRIDLSLTLAIIPVIRPGIGPEELFNKNRELIQKAAERGLGPYQLVVERTNKDGTWEEPALLLLSGQRGLGLVSDFSPFRVPEGIVVSDHGDCRVFRGGKQDSDANRASLELLEQLYTEVTNWRGGTCRFLGLTKPQNSLSAQAFRILGLQY